MATKTIPEPLTITISEEAAVHVKQFAAADGGLRSGQNIRTEL